MFSAVGACSLGNHVYVYGGYDGYTSLHTVGMLEYHLHFFKRL